jgi:beta-phosphoglucomutase-like phosphatase (HAD superfamily)
MGGEVLLASLAADGPQGAGNQTTTVSSEEVTRGKPAPDVSLAAAAGLGAEPARCVAIEDSSNGLAAAEAARMTVIAVPNRHFPRSADTLGRAALVVASLADHTEEQIRHRATP